MRSLALPAAATKALATSIIYGQMRSAEGRSAGVLHDDDSGPSLFAACAGFDQSPLLLLLLLLLTQLMPQSTR
jgi:hypothetical protein